MVRNLKQIKSTMLGGLLIGVGIYTLIDQVGTEYTQLFLIVAGSGLLFAPDRFINVFEKWLLGQEIKLKKDNTEDNEDITNITT